LPASRWTVVCCALAISLIAPRATLAGSARGGTCHAATYSYAGLESRAVARGIAATIMPTAAPAVRDGHVAGWVGVGGYGVGPRGTDEWIQIGLIAFPNSTARIYYEVTRPGEQPVQRTLRERVVVSERHRFAVLELGGHPNWWRVWLDGRPVGEPVFLPRSHARLTAQMTGESYTGLSEGQCNLYSFAFQHVALAGTGASFWSAPRRFDLFQDPSYLLERRSTTSFVARSIEPIA
jgi:hypothetical protein